MMAFERELRLYEIICARMNISFMVDLNATNLCKETLNKALKCAKAKHPYLRMKMVDNQGNDVLSNQFKNSFQSFKYVEITDDEAIFIPIIEQRLKSHEAFNDWQQMLIDVANRDRNFSKSLIFLDLVSLENSNRHKIYGCINHSGNLNELKLI